MMRGGGAGLGRPPWRRDAGVLEQPLTPGIVKRVLKLALGYRWMLALFLALVVVDAVLGTINPLILRDIINEGIGGHDRQLVIELALLAAGVATLDMLVTLVQRYVSARIGESLIFDLRRQVFGHVQRMPIAFFTRTQTGALVSRLNNDIIGAQQAFTNTLGSVVSNLITVTIVFVAMLALSWEITLASLALLPLFVIPARLVGKKLQAITRERYMLSATMNSTMTERFNVAGALLVKLFGTPQAEQQSFEEQAARVRDTGISASLYNGFFYSSMFLLTSLATALVYGWGGVLTVDGALDIGTVVALTAYLQRLYGPLNQLSSVQIDVMTALVSFDRVFEVLDLEPMIDDKPGAVDVPPGPARIEFDHVGFRYPRADEVSLASLESVAVLDQTPSHPVLHDVSFAVEPGQLVALVGPSGAGKTTISNLVPRLYDVREGAIRINGLDVRAGRAPLPRHDPRQPRIRASRRD
jgi:ATP-binding cassette subfamily B protein